MPMRELLDMSLISELVKEELQHHLRRKAVRLGLSVLELQVLWCVVVSGDAVFRDLTTLTHCPEDVLRPVIESLETDGLLERVIGQGSRKCLLRATVEGKNLMEMELADDGIRYLPLQLEEELIHKYVQACCNLLRRLRGSETSECFIRDCLKCG